MTKPLIKLVTLVLCVASIVSEPVVAVGPPSTFSASAEEAGDDVPAGSVPMAVKLWLPSPSAVVGVKDQAPLLFAVVWPRTVLPSSTVMVSPASPVPEIVGSVALVSPLSRVWPLLTETLRPDGAPGVWVSSVSVIDVELPVPPALVSLATSAFAPCASVTLVDHVPLGCTTAVATGVVPPLS